MDAQPLLVVNCGDFVTRDGNIICSGQCFLDLIRDHVGYGMSDLPTCRLRPMFARQMWYIQHPEQIFASSEIIHRPASTEEVEHSAELHHLHLALLCDASRYLVKNCLTSPCVEDLLVFYVLVMAKVIVLALFHLHGIA
jgi:hypothetical protein